ncbi:MAG: hypothetical protein WCJ46_02820 [bacterium]
MPDNSNSDILLRKQRLIKIVLLIVNRQHRWLKQAQIQKVITIDERKLSLLKEVHRIDEVFATGKVAHKDNYLELSVKINADINALIELEKENETMILEYEGMWKGKHISAYKKYNK